MEYIKGGSLKDMIIKRYNDTTKDYLFTDIECSIIIKGILEAINYLHQHNIVHRDIKPDNILFKDENDLNSICLCDFGMACRFSNYELSMQEKCGTLIFMAPEVISKANYDHLVDSYSVGIIVYLLASGGVHPIYKHGMSSSEYQELVVKMKKNELKRNTYNKNKDITDTNEVQVTFPIYMPVLARNLFLKLTKCNTLVNRDLMEKRNSYLKKVKK